LLRVVYNCIRHLLKVRDAVNSPTSLPLEACARARETDRQTEREREREREGSAVYYLKAVHPRCVNTTGIAVNNTTYIIKRIF
jgi:hypothetical protein